MKLNINSRLFAAVGKFKASSDIRYYLNGVYVEPIASGGVLIAATNGHALGLWKDADGLVERPAILRTSPKLLAACVAKNAAFLQLIEDRLTVTEKLGFEVYVQPRREGWEIQGTFPNVMRVIPKTEATPTLFDGLNPTYVSRVTDALKVGTNNSKYGCSVSFNQPEKNSGIVVTSNSAEAHNFLAVIMPLRDAVSHQPTWLQAMKADAEAEAKKGAEA
jgi:hypothetical protein